MRFSVIITTYNRKDFVINAVNSVLSQTINDLEIIVVDDGSTDGTQDELLKRFNNQIVYIYQENRERGAARNIGIKSAKGEYIVWLDSDDEWYPDHLETILNKTSDKKEVGLVYTLARCVSETGKDLGLHQKNGTPSGDVLEMIIKGNFVTFSTACIRKEVFEKVGFFSEDREMSGSEDWQMWVRIACHFHFYNISEVTVKYRVHDNASMSDINIIKKCKFCALESLFNDKSLLNHIIKYKDMSFCYGNIFISSGYYAAGDMPLARLYLFNAGKSYPSIIFKRRFIYYYLRTFLGVCLTQKLRKYKGINRFIFFTI